MTELGKRIQQLRKEKGFSQTDLAKKIGVSYAQLSRYEIKGSQPPAEVLNKMADAFDTSVDFLINGNSTEKAMSSLKNVELLKQFREVDLLPEEDKKTIIRVVSAYIRDFKTRQAYSA
jgi:transcriptional regulator with XRE-family HTH domain